MLGRFGLYVSVHLIFGLYVSVPLILLFECGVTLKNHPRRETTKIEGQINSKLLNYFRIIK